MDPDQNEDDARERGHCLDLKRVTLFLRALILLHRCIPPSPNGKAIKHRKFQNAVHSVDLLTR